MKAVGWYSIFIISSIVIIVGAALVIFWNYIQFQGKEANREACIFKLQNYCYRWITEKKEPGDWDSIYPQQGCEKFDVNKPTSLDQCKAIFGLK
jgi:hypothetical protein